MFSHKVSDFLHFLRQNGHIIGVREVNDIFDSLSFLEEPDKEISRHYLRTLCCRNKQEWANFDELFDRFWQAENINNLSDNESTVSERISSKPQSSVSGIAGTSKSQLESIDSPVNGGAGKQNTIAKADFRFLNDANAMHEAESMAEKLALHLKTRTRSHKKICLTGRKMDMRHTIRKSLGFGGVPIKPAYSIKYKKTPHIVLLHDVSHSMSWNNPLLFRFARGLVRTCDDSDAFVFHTQLFCVSDIYREKSIQQMRDKLESRNHLWLGGTCIAESIGQFNQQYAKSVLKSNSIIIIISDGFDTDTPEKLTQQLKLLRLRSKQILWLNPMLGRESYEPDSENLLAARPFVNHFLPAHSVDALRKVIYSINL